MRRDYYRGSQDSLAVRGERFVFLLLIFFLNLFTSFSFVDLIFFITFVQYHFDVVILPFFVFVCQTSVLLSMITISPLRIEFAVILPVYILYSL